MAVLTAGVLAGMLMTDTLCPEHRTWVLTLGSVGIVAILTAAVGLWRGWAWSPILSLVGSLSGIAIGLIDATHAAARGSFIAVAFSVLALGATWLVWKQAEVLVWDRRVRRDLASPPMTSEAADEGRAVGEAIESGDAVALADAPRPQQASLPE